MPNITQIQVGTTTYDIADEIANNNINSITTSLYSLTTSLTTMAFQSDAPSNDKEYTRKNGDWVEASGVNIDLNTKTDLSVIAEEFSENISYNTSNYVTYNGKLYVFSDSHSAGSWTGNDVNEIKIAGILQTKADIAALGALANHDTVNYSTEVTNKPTLGSLAALNSISYTSDLLSNKPTLGTLAAKNDSSSTDGKTYGRQNAAWKALGSMALINDVSSTTKLYGRTNGSWTALGSMASINDATNNSTLYGRKGGNWAAVPTYSPHVETGATESLTLSGTSYTTKTVTFDNSFSNTNYIIILTMNCNATVSAFGQVSYSYHSKAKNGFSIKIYNASSAQRSGFNIAWAAIQL